MPSGERLLLYSNLKAMYSDDVCGRPFSLATIHGDFEALVIAYDQRKKRLFILDMYSLFFYI